MRNIEMNEIHAAGEFAAGIVYFHGSNDAALIGVIAAAQAHLNARRVNPQVYVQIRNAGLHPRFIETILNTRPKMSKENTMKDPRNYPDFCIPPAPQVPQAAAANAQAVTDRKEQLRSELEKIEKAEAAAAERDAIHQRIIAQQELVQATSVALSEIRALTNGQPATQLASLAKYRKELSALVAEYGYKIALVGDKSHGVLVQA